MLFKRQDLFYFLYNINYVIFAFYDDFHTRLNNQLINATVKSIIIFLDSYS